MKNIFLGEAFVNNTLENISIKEEMSSKAIALYIMRAFMAGVLIVFGYLLIMGLDAGFNDELNVVGTMTGATMFSLVLAAIYFTKSELLTSNMMITTVGKYYQKINFSTMLKILVFCYLGNLLGGLFTGALISATTVLTPGMVDSMKHSVEMKQAYIANKAFVDLFIRAIFANFFINVAMLMIYSQNVTSDFGKVIVMFFGVFSFVFLGMEHSVANTELFAIAGMTQLIQGVDTGFNLGYAISNVGIALMGNFIGGGFLIGYYYAYINDSTKVKGAKKE
ncbi:MAG: formate/nitrite transporter family protein [Mycoplasmatales bacterium]